MAPQGDGYMLTLTDDISSLLKDYDAFDQRRVEAKALFPEGVFQEKTNRTRILDRPLLEAKHLATEKIIPVAEVSDSDNNLTIAG